jgi:hypothetical protein
VNKAEKSRKSLSLADKVYRDSMLTPKYYDKKEFAIAAPLKDFNVDDMELTKGELKRKPVVDEDPIVLQPVRYGGKTHFLIVTAWGDEASDPLVLNQNHN